MRGADYTQQQPTSIALLLPSFTVKFSFRAYGRYSDNTVAATELIEEWLNTAFRSFLTSYAAQRPARQTPSFTYNIAVEPRVQGFHHRLNTKIYVDAVVYNLPLDNDVAAHLDFEIYLPNGVSPHDTDKIVCSFPKIVAAAAQNATRANPILETVHRDPDLVQILNDTMEYRFDETAPQQSPAHREHTKRTWIDAERRRIAQIQNQIGYPQNPAGEKMTVMAPRSPKDHGSIKNDILFDYFFDGHAQTTWIPPDGNCFWWAVLRAILKNPKESWFTSQQAQENMNLLKQLFNEMYTAAEHAATPLPVTLSDATKQAFVVGQSAFADQDLFAYVSAFVNRPVWLFSDSTLESDFQVVRRNVLQCFDYTDCTHFVIASLSHIMPIFEQSIDSLHNIHSKYPNNEPLVFLYKGHDITGHYEVVTGYSWLNPHNHATLLQEALNKNMLRHIQDRGNNFIEYKIK